MRVVKDVTEVTVKVSKEELLEGKYVSYSTVSGRLRKMEEDRNEMVKALRVKFYNSTSTGKYTIIDRFGMKFIDIEKPMKDNSKASLMLKFEVC